MNTYRKILGIFLALCLIFGALSLVACEPKDSDNGGNEGDGGENGGENNGGADNGGNGGNNSGDNGGSGDAAPTTATYTVTIIDENGAPVVGAKAQVCCSTTCWGFPATSDGEGKITFTVTYDATNKLQLNSVPTGYTLPESGTAGATDLGLPAYYFDTNNSVTVTVAAVANGDSQNPGIDLPDQNL